MAIKKPWENSGNMSFWRWHPESNWGIEVLQTSALPLGYVTSYEIVKISGKMERKTRLELATPTLARWCSTNWAISASCWHKRKMATRRGLEPLTSAVTGRHSNQLNYRAVILLSHLRDNNWNYSEYKAHCQHFFKKILKPKKNDSEHKSLTVIAAFTTH